ncbi:unnamed protein product [Moneuplotes crassus]|uniref:Uncharacterized protein n=1 Tax=Euplotes crassus TaxID=5936 RepID=A0AAD2CX97_EUPCR|nr:unnamed protein product [Moneuplotes crassus]
MNTERICASPPQVIHTSLISKEEKPFRPVRRNPTPYKDVLKRPLLDYQEILDSKMSHEELTSRLEDLLGHIKKVDSLPCSKLYLSPSPCQSRQEVVMGSNQNNGDYLEENSRFNVKTGKSDEEYTSEVDPKGKISVLQSEQDRFNFTPSAKQNSPEIQDENSKIFDEQKEINGFRRSSGMRCPTPVERSIRTPSTIQVQLLDSPFQSEQNTGSCPDPGIAKTVELIMQKRNEQLNGSPATQPKSSCSYFLTMFLTVLFIGLLCMVIWTNPLKQPQITITPECSFEFDQNLIEDLTVQIKNLNSQLEAARSENILLESKLITSEKDKQALIETMNSHINLLEAEVL